MDDMIGENMNITNQFDVLSEALQNFSKTNTYVLNNMVSLIKDTNERFQNISITYSNLFKRLSDFIKANSEFMEEVYSKKYEWVDKITSVSLETSIASLKLINNICSNSKKDYLDLKPITDLQIGYNTNNISVISKDTGYCLRENVKKDVEEAVDDSISTKILKINKENMELLTKLNSIDKDIIKYTPDCWVNVNALGIIADDHDKFRIMINACYQIYYEGMANIIYNQSKNIHSKYNISFDDKIAPLHIKRLRLKEFHDINHGDEKDIEKKNADIEGVYTIYINKKEPVAAKDYKLSQYKLYCEINQWLLSLMDIVNVSFDIEHSI